MNQKDSAINGDEEQLNTNGEPNSGDENEEVWRKMRFERETILKEDAVKNENLGNENIGTNLDAKKKIKIFNRKSFIPNSTLPKSPFYITQELNSRKSFLSGDETALLRLSNFIKNDSDGTQLDSGKSKNFVFTTLSPSVNENKNVI